MPRRNRGGGGSSAFRPAPRPARSSPPPAVQHAPPPAPIQANSGGSMMGGLGATIAQGMAFGTGSAMAHRAVEGIMGPRTMAHDVSMDSQASESVNSSGVSLVNGADACANQFKSFHDCLNVYGSDIGKCQFYVDMLNECRRGPSASVTL